MPRHPSVSRRELLKAGVALAAATLAPSTVLAQTELLTRPVPSTGVRLPVVGLGTNRFRSGDPAWTARMRETLAARKTEGAELRATRAVITVPAYFDAPQVEATRRAGELAGEVRQRIGARPTAAAAPAPARAVIGKVRRMWSPKNIDTTLGTIRPRKGITPTTTTTTAAVQTSGTLMVSNGPSRNATVSLPVRRVR